VLALPFLRLPAVLVALFALLAFALPSLVLLPLPDARWAGWTGLSGMSLATADFVPVFPWFGCVLAGIVLARLALPHLIGRALAGWRPASRAARAVAWAGRHSLMVYLVHQPLFIGALMLATQIIAPPSPEERAFQTECRRSCASPNAPERICRAVCACTIDALKRDGLWQKALDDLLSQQESLRMTELAQGCLRGGG
jgi:uncharacterized membrane protein